MIRQMVKADLCSYISEYYPDQNFTSAGKEAVFIGRFRGNGDIYRSLVAFDLSPFKSFPVLIEQGCPAYLRLHICRNEVRKGAVNASIHRILANWEPRDITWTNQPQINSIPDITFVIPGGWTGLILLNVSKLVHGWVTGSLSNFGIMIKGNENSDGLIAFNSSVEPGPRTAPVIYLSTRQELV